MPPRPQPPTDTSALLLEAARRCLRSLGYRRTTARAIAAESGANLRSIGYHHGSVQALVLRALSANFRDWLAPLFQPVPPEQAASAIADGLSRFTASFEDNAGNVCAWLQAVGDARDDPALRRQLAANQHGFRDALVANLAAAGVAEPGPAAEALITVCDGLFIRNLLHGENPPVEEVVARAADALRAIGRS